MKIAIIGGGGVRTPKLLIGLLHEQELLNLTEVSLMDNDTERLELIGYLAEKMLSISNKDCKFRITYCDNYRSAVTGAKFVISSIRAGKEDGRIKDERIPLKYGVLGQETIGPGGFAMALRNIPPIIELAHSIEVYAPDAWLINFTNPSGIITQAVVSYCNVKMIGICDEPLQLETNLKNIYNLPDDSTFIDYFGLNHLGWIKRVIVNQSDEMPKILVNIENYVNSSETCKVFTSDFIRELGLIPNNYLYFFYYNHEAVERIKHSKITRGEMLKKLNAELFSKLKESKERDILETYYLYDKARSNSYMKIDTGKFDSNKLAEYVTLRQLANISSAKEENVMKILTSYDRNKGYSAVALKVIKNLLNEKGDVLTVLGKNEGTIPWLSAEDVIEVPAHISKAGRYPFSISGVPTLVEGLIRQVKEFERYTVEAAYTGSYSKAIKALTIHPLVQSYSLAVNILNDYLEVHRENLPQFN